MNEKQSVTEQFEKKETIGGTLNVLHYYPTSAHFSSEMCRRCNYNTRNCGKEMWSLVLYGYVRTYNPVINDTGRPSGTTEKFLARFDVFTVMLCDTVQIGK
jgi:hypothetical protein